MCIMCLHVFKAPPTLSVDLRQLKTKAYQYETGLPEIPKRRESIKPLNTYNLYLSPLKISKRP